MRVVTETTKKEHSKALSEKEAAIAALHRKMDHVTIEFAEMLKVLYNNT